MQEVDPLDAFMESLSSEVRSIAAAGRVDRSRLPQARNQQIASNVSAVARRRRYAKLAALAAEGYFDDDAMRERSPALFHSMLGEYLGETLQEGSGDYEEARHITAEDVREDMRHVGMLLRDAMRTVVANRSYEAGPASSSIRSRPLNQPQQVEPEFEEEFDDEEDEQEQEQEQETEEGGSTASYTATVEMRMESAAETRFGAMDGEEEAHRRMSSRRLHVVTPDYAASAGASHEAPIEADDVTEQETQGDAEELEARRQELITAMRERFLDGLDVEFVNYEEIDADERLDHFVERERELQDQWFDADD